jgi:putative acetyltransferase
LASGGKTCIVEKLFHRTNWRNQKLLNCSAYTGNKYICTNGADSIKQLDAELRLRNGDAMDEYDQHNVIAPIETVVVAYEGGKPAGCGCFKYHNEHTAEIKRMFVTVDARGKGVSRNILGELELWAHELGFTTAILETGAKQTEALGLYHRAGYTPIGNYAPYEGMDDSYCFRKELE